MKEIEALIAKARDTRAWHVSRGAKGEIEALAAAIREGALREALAAVQRERGL